MPQEAIFPLKTNSDGLLIVDSNLFAGRDNFPIETLIACVSSQESISFICGPYPPETKQVNPMFLAFLRRRCEVAAEQYRQSVQAAIGA